MMNEGEALALGRRATRCNRWKWAPGMLVTAPRSSGAGAPETGLLYARLVSMGGLPREMRDRRLLIGLVDSDAIPEDTTLAPDLRDPATLGWLLALVRDAWPTAPATTARFCYYSPERGSYSNWACTYWRPDDGPSRGAWFQAHGETEIEALVAALEVAGVRETGNE